MVECKYITVRHDGIFVFDLTGKGLEERPRGCRDDNGRPRIPDSVRNNVSMKFGNLQTLNSMLYTVKCDGLR